MPKVLRVGFAMGGGVSLGTFCGTALSQALKLLIVHGCEANGQRFGRVEVDVFSGASAGALSLAAMLRSLGSPDPIILNAVKDDLQVEFGGAFQALSPAQQSDLCATEIMQRFQRQLWSDEIKLDKLLGEGLPGELRYKPSLLDRGAVDDIAHRHIVLGNGTADFSTRRVLADRVLFACTLTNLTPVICDARASLPGKDIGYIGLNDGLRSSSHRDLRVFDLNFAPVANPGSSFYADRWCLYHTGQPVDGLIGSLKQADAWAKLAATAIASGAFPGAFEPVVLPRKAFEYGPERWNRIMGRRPASPFDGSESLPFTYMDGGTLNNEPIREAFRLASFIDGHTRAADPQADFQRLIIFVDPNVSPTRPSFRIAGHQIWSPITPGTFTVSDGPAARRKTSLSRLAPHLFTLLGAIVDESSAVEADKINEVHTLFDERDQVRKALAATLTAQPADSDLGMLITFCGSRLSASKKDDMIPPGPMTPAGELERVCHEEKLTDPASPLAALQTKAETFLADFAAGRAVANRELWLRALAFVAVDLILRVEGKLQDAVLVAIGPFRNLNNVTNGKEPDPIPLPGAALSGFAGFMSDIPDEVEHAAAKYCATEFLRACGLVPAATPMPPASGLQLTYDQQQQFERDVKSGLERLAARVAAMVRDADLINIFPGLDALIVAAITSYVKAQVKGIDWKAKQETTCTFRVGISNESFEFDGEDRDIDGRPVRNPETGAWELIAVAAWDGADWTGPFVKRNRVDIDQQGALLLPDKDFCEIELPDSAMMAKQEFLPNPTFYIDLSKAKAAAKPRPASDWTALPGTTPLEDLLLA